ncbi:hypothetical protein [Aeoliella sp.]|uniref:hypothetical protein n=1 Tax=Aeoliella sp. TaxID=2795800 RepID=UPI003CCB7D37
MSETSASTISIDFTCESLEALHKLLGVDSVAEQTSATIGDGTTVVVEELMPCAGLTGKEILVTIVISIATGIPSGIAANWIYDNVVTDPQLQSVQVEGTPREFKAVHDVEQIVDLARSQS